MRGVTFSAVEASHINPFLLTRLMRGVTRLYFLIVVPMPFLLTRLMRGVTTRRGRFPKRSIISTHTPHARRDGSYAAVVSAIFYFYSHASCEA